MTKLKGDFGYLWHLEKPTFRWWEHTRTSENSEELDELQAEIEAAPPSWQRYKIIDMNAGRVFVERRDVYAAHYKGSATISLYRSGLETAGRSTYNDGTIVMTFYTDEGRAAFERECAEQAQRLKAGRAALSAAEAKALGLSAGHSYGVADIIAAYRKRALACHPDHGGSDEEFRKLTAAKNDILSRISEEAEVS